MEHQHLHILWTTSDKLTSYYMVLQYATSCILQDWWDEVTVILWGASAKLAAEDPDIQEKIKVALRAGVRVSVCTASARQMGGTRELEALGVELKPWGKELSTLIQQGENILTV